MTSDERDGLRTGPGLPWLIGCGCLIAMLTFGTRAGFGLFNAPITAANGWDRETFALAMALQNLLWGFGQPFAGALADKFGVTRVLSAGALVYAAGVALMALSTTPWQLYLSAGVLVGLGGAAASYAIVMAALARMVGPARRSWALGIIVAASSLGMAVYALVDAALIAAFGWSNALLLIAASLLLVPLLARTYRGEAGSAGLGGQTIGQALREAAGNRSYWLLVLGFFVCGYHVAFMQVHLPSYLVDQGLSPGLGGVALMLIGLFNIVGSYTAGVLGGRQSKKNLLALIYLGRALLIAVYVLLPPSAATTMIFAAVMGLLWLSTVPLTSGLIAVLFGPRYMATLYGIVFFSHQIGSFLGVWLGGWLFDRTGSYDVVWWTSVLLGVLAALVHLPIRERSASVVLGAPA